MTLKPKSLIGKIGLGELIQTVFLVAAIFAAYAALGTRLTVLEEHNKQSDKNIVDVKETLATTTTKNDAWRDKTTADIAEMRGDVKVIKNEVERKPIATGGSHE